LSLPENLRQEYLNAMGIDSYFPRLLLPGAPPPRRCEWPQAWKQQALPQPEAVPEPVTGRQAVPGEEPVVPPVAELAPSPRVVAPTSPVPEAPPAEPADTGTAGKTVEEARFQTVFIRINDDLCAINLMPYVGQRQLAGVHRALLGNMLSAAGINPESMQVDDAPFRWPLTEGVRMDSSKQAARAALTAYLEQKCAGRPFTQLLVMGELALSAMADEDAGQAFLQGQPWLTVFTRSLDEILNRPQLKQEVWLRLRTLRKATG